MHNYIIVKLILHRTQWQCTVWTPDPVLGKYRADKWLRLDWLHIEKLKTNNDLV